VGAHRDTPSMFRLLIPLLFLTLTAAADSDLPLLGDEAPAAE